MLIGLAVSILATSPPAEGCAAGWESNASLLARARCVIQVEVLAVEDAPKPAPVNDDDEGLDRGYILESDDGRERVAALASVRVLNQLKGSCLTREFKLLGGPYYSCAPFPCYWTFKKGERLFLILDQNIPKELSMLTITWRSRVTRGSADEMRHQIAEAKRLWEQGLARHKDCDPTSFAEALQIHQQGIGQWGNLSALSYPVLASLQQLSSAPDQLPPPKPTTPVLGTLRTAQRGKVETPKSLQAALEKRFADQAPEVAAYNREMFRNFLIHELLLEPEMVERLLKHEVFEKSFLVTDFHPGSCEMWLNRSEEEGREIETLYYLLAFADETGELGASRLFAGGDGLKLHTNMILPWVLKNQDREFPWSSLALLMQLDSEELLPIVTKALNRETNSARLTHYFAYFLAIDEAKLAMAVMKRIEQEEIALSAAKLDPDRRERELGMIEYLLELLQNTIHTAKPSSAEFSSKLEQMKAKAKTL